MCSGVFGVRNGRRAYCDLITRSTLVSHFEFFWAGMVGRRRCHGLISRGTFVISHGRLFVGLKQREASDALGDGMMEAAMKGWAINICTMTMHALLLVSVL